MAKGKTKKIVVGILIGLLVLILALALVFKLYGNQLIRTGIIAGSQKALQVGVRLESIDLKVIGGKVDLKNMEIDNPKGYKNPTFLKLGHAYIDLDMPTLMSDTVEITTVQLEDINLVIEQNGTTNNLKDILNNLPKSETAKSESKPSEKGAGKNLRIKVLEINNVNVEAKLLPIPGRADQIKLPPINIRLENVGTDEKIDMSGLIKQIITEISKGIAEKGKDVLPMDMIGSITDELSKQGEQLLKTGQEAGQQLLEGTKDIGKGATDAVKGIGDLFKKKEKQ
jgi:hypothetical protein